MGADAFRWQSTPDETPRTLHRTCFRIGGVSVQVASDRRADVALAPSLMPFRVALGPSDINIRVGWVADLSSAPGRQLFDSGSLWRLYETHGGFQFDFTTPVLGDSPYKRLLIDDKFHTASLLLNEECFEDRNAPTPLEYPLDEVLITHRLSREKAIELHGCGIDARKSRAGYLFVGHSGAGKSTTARLWTAHQDVEILSDDRIILREHEGKTFMYGTPWHGEAAYASPAQSPLSKIFVLEHGFGNAIARLSPSQTISELFARSFVPFHRHDYVNSALDVLQQVAASVPCYRYSFEPDQRAVEKILQFHDE
jgi:hypothetical protein